MWGPYPALVHKPNSIVHGMAYEVQTEQQVEILKHYETENYKLRGSKVKFSDGREVSGKVFVWNSDTALLKEGVFDLKDWQMQQIDALMDED